MDYLLTQGGPFRGTRVNPGMGNKNSAEKGASKSVKESVDKPSEEHSQLNGKPSMVSRKLVCLYVW